MVYIPFEAPQANTQQSRPDDMTDGGQTSTVMLNVSWISPSLETMVSEWSPMAKLIIIPLRLSDKNERSNQLQTLLQWQHHLFASWYSYFQFPDECWSMVRTYDIIRYSSPTRSSGRPRRSHSLDLIASTFCGAFEWHFKPPRLQGKPEQTVDVIYIAKKKTELFWSLAL